VDAVLVDLGMIVKGVVVVGVGVLARVGALVVVGVAIADGVVKLVVVELVVNNGVVLVDVATVVVGRVPASLHNFSTSFSKTLFSCVKFDTKMK